MKPLDINDIINTTDEKLDKYLEEMKSKKKIEPPKADVTAIDKETGKKLNDIVKEIAESGVIKKPAEPEV